MPITQRALDILLDAGVLPLADIIRASKISPGKPVDWIEFPADTDFLSTVGLRSIRTTEFTADLTHSTDFTRVAGELIFAETLAVTIPGLSGVELVVGASTQPKGILLQWELDVGMGVFACRLTSSVALRFGRNILQPVINTPPTSDPPTWKIDPNGFVQILISGTLEVDGDGDVTFGTNSGAFSLAPAMIGNTGVVIRFDDITPIFSSKATLPAGHPAEVSAGWRGVYIKAAKVYLPAELGHIVDEIDCTNCYIGSGGFTGKVTASWSPVKTGQFLGLDVTLSEVSLEFRQNCLTECDIKGTLKLPFFDKPLAVDIGIDGDGNLHVAASAQPPVPIHIGGLLDFTVSSLRFEVDDGELSVILSGKLKPLIDIGSNQWPAFDVRELRIDSKGHVHLDGGWLPLPEQYAFKLHGFGVEISAITFGENDDARKFIGFTGGVQLSTGKMGLGAEFKNLLISWPKAGVSNAADIEISLRGVVVDLTIPDTLKFHGTVDFINETNPESHGFRGSIELALYQPALTINAELLCLRVGPTGSEYTAFYVYVNANFPGGIQIGATGVALYALAGLYGQNVRPDKLEQEHWYEHWYKGKRLENKRQGDPTGADAGVSLGITGSDKWQPDKGQLAFGAGAAFGTMADDGYSVSGKLLLVILLPGPVFLLEGRADMLKKRADLPPDSEGSLEALAILDGRAGHLLINIAAHYRKPADGKIIDISAGAEAFFDFHNAGNWRLYIGEKTPEDKRIRALVLSLFKANSYFMLTARDLQLGFWVGFDKHGKVGPLTFGLSAWISADAAVSWKPVHVWGQLQLHGAFDLKAFGVGLSLTVDALIAAETPTPYHLVAALHIALKLPKPLPKVKADVQLEWGPRAGVPPFPLLLTAAAIVHHRVSEKWLLDRLPIFDSNGDGFVSDDDTETDDARTLAGRVADRYDEDNLKKKGIGLPIVPLDARPLLSFARPVYDDIGFGHARAGFVERVGGSSFRYLLRAIALHRIARSAVPNQHPDAVAWGPAVEERTAGSAATPKLLAGTWQLVCSGDDVLGNSILMLGAPSTAEWTSEQSAASYWNWLQQHLPEQDCPPESTPFESCVNFEDIGGLKALRIVNDPVARTYTFAHDGLVFTVGPLAPLLFDRFIEEFALGNALGLPVPSNEPVVLTIDLPKGTSWVQILFDPESRFVDPASGAKVQGIHLSRQGAVPAGSVAISEDIGQPRTATITDPAGLIDRVTLIGGPLGTAGQSLLIYLYQVCVKGILNPDTQSAHDNWPQAIAETQAIWKLTDTLFEPDSIYRLTVTMEVERSGGDPPHVKDQIQTLYFQTAQPPGVLTSDTPPPPPAIEPGTVPVGVGNPPPNANAHEHYPTHGPLADLSVYVARTVPAAGQRSWYRAYDIAVLFNEPYVEEMYDKASRSLHIVLIDGNGGVIDLPPLWDHNPVKVLSVTEAEWLYGQQQAAACGWTPALPVVDLTTMPKDQAAIATAPDLLLAPEVVHEGRLVSDDPNPATHAATPWDPYTVYSWRFIASRFAHFRHQVGSFKGRAWDEHVIRGQPSTPLLDSAEVMEIHNLLTAEMAHTPLTSNDPPRFARVAYLLGFGTDPQLNAPGVWRRPAPLGVELTVLDDATRRYGLLLESAEPFNPARASLGAGAGADPEDVAIEVLWTPTLVPLPTTPGAAAILDSNIAPISVPPNDEFIDVLVLTDKLDVSGWTIEHSGSAAVFPAYTLHFTFPAAGPKYRQGSVLRIHSGFAAANSPADVTHLYAGLSTVALGATGAADRLRLLDQTGKVVHARALFSHRPMHEVPLDATVLWNHDRTAAFLFLASGSDRVATFPDGIYRLPCRFRRQLVDPDAPILSQRQSTDDEALYLEWVVGAEAFHAQNGDFDQDGLITEADLLEIAGQWQVPPIGALARFDLNGDGAIDVLDIQRVAALVGKEL